ncbi:alpha/beta hydrolase [Fortiea contorta]|uniref:alpha/beta hydrolase n=1 Tax=Fortiea contorta TaxID=1892405 RepID=UPI00034D132B|nr:alpha/beta fold hydrolase [Fortiea contorta]
MNIKKLHFSVNTLFYLLLVFLSFAAIAYCGFCLFLFVQQPRLIFFPTSEITKTPKLFNLPYEDVWIPIKLASGKVEHIHGWWIKGKQADSKVLLYLHGNGLNISANVGHASRFYKLGFSVLLIDYRGYGLSKGTFPSEMQVYEDTMTAWNYLVQQQKIPPNHIFIYGHSLGGAIAIDLAVKHPEAAGLIVESSFTSIREVVAYRNSFSLFPIDLILTQRFESIKKLPKLKMPVLFIHGTNDSTIPYFMSQKLYAAAPEPKKLLLVPKAEHNDVADIAGEQYLQWVDAFTQQVYAHK